MTEHTQHADQGGPSHRRVEIGVAVAMALFGLIAVYGSLQAGIDWGIEGPKAGFFPFYVGLLIVAGSLYNLAQQIRSDHSDHLFADWSQLRRVMLIAVPAAVYVALVPIVGIYVSSALLIGLFMKWIGRFGWPLTLVVALGIPLATFIVFERLFLIPLPKGPIEDALGF